MNNVIKTKVSTAKCIQASRCSNTGKAIYTLELEYPRIIHSQLLTHGVFSKNSSSTRAVPLETAINQIQNNPAKYIWTTNQSGMQGDVVTDYEQLRQAEITQEIAMNNAIKSVREHASNGIHKQNAGRLLEPFQNIKIILTATEWENWDWLRIHEDAQGEIHDLALAMKEARETATVVELKPGEWHVPFVDRFRDTRSGTMIYSIYDAESGVERNLSLEEAKDLSASVCAQVSYRRGDFSLEKASKIKKLLVNGHKIHASPFEHQATPISVFDDITGINDPYDFDTWEEGITHLRRDGTFGSGNFVGFIQQRQCIPRHDKALF